MGAKHLETHYFVRPCYAICARQQTVQFEWSRFTHIIDPLDPRLELRQTEMDLDTEHDRPVRLSIPTLLRLSTPRKRRQIRTDVAQRRELLRCTVDPLGHGVAAPIAPDLDLEHGKCGQVGDLCAVLAAEHVRLFHTQTLDDHQAGQVCSYNVR